MSTSKISAALQNHRDPRVAAMYRRLAKGRAKAAPSTPESTRHRKAKPAATKATPAPSKRATARSFDHLAPAPHPIDDDVTAAAKPAMSPKARAILTAAEKARTPTGTGAAKPKGLAADIIAAGKNRRGETK